MIIINNHRYKITIGKITKKDNKLFVILLVNIHIYITIINSNVSKFKPIQ